VSFTTDPIGGLAKRRPTYLITLPFGRRVAREARRFDVWTTPPLEVSCRGFVRRVCVWRDQRRILSGLFKDLEGGAADECQ